MLPSTKKDSLETEGAQGRLFTLKKLKRAPMILELALVQKPGKAVNDGNPMGLAMSIKVLYAEIEEEILIRKSWNENPFGAAPQSMPHYPQFHKNPFLLMMVLVHQVHSGIQGIKILQVSKTGIQ